MAAEKELDFFNDIVVFDEEGKEQPVPITHSETAKNVRFETTTSMELPALVLHGDDKPFTLYALTTFHEEMSMIIEQVIIKFGQGGVNENIGLRLTTMSYGEGSTGGVLKHSFVLEAI